MASRRGGTLCRASCHWRSIVQGPPPLEEPSRASSKSGHASPSGGEGSVALASRNLGRKEKVTDLAAKFLDLRRNVVPNNLFQATFQTAGTKYEETLRGNSTYKKILFYRSFKSTAMLNPTMGLKILFVSNAGSSYLSPGLVQTPWASSSSV